MLEEVVPCVMDSRLCISIEMVVTHVLACDDDVIHAPSEVTEWLTATPQDTT